MVAEDYRLLAERGTRNANALVARIVGERPESVKLESRSFHCFTAPIRCICTSLYTTRIRRISAANS